MITLLLNLCMMPRDILQIISLLYNKSLSILYNFTGINTNY